jgi:hypothetical protein
VSFILDLVLIVIGILLLALRGEVGKIPSAGPALAVVFKVLGIVLVVLGVLFLVIDLVFLVV